jgi:UDP-N-acetylmuramate--alanine ligase
VYAPEISIITNVEPDHLDHYGTADAVEAAFDAFADRVRPGGLLVACADDPGALRVARRAAERRQEVRVLTYGTNPRADVVITEPTDSTGGVRFRLTEPADAGSGPGTTRHEICLRVPGRHNALNACAAWIAASIGLGLPSVAVAAGLETFSGTRRRFEAKVRGQSALDDYAHHPTEVEAVLRAARGVAGPGRVVVAFQPHLFSRTRIFAADFAAALGLADEVVVLDVYAAREDPEPGVTGALIADQVPLPGDQVAFVPRIDDVLGN